MGLLFKMGIQHGASAVKTRSMYGQRLKAQDFAHMKTLKTVPDAASYLKSHPAWQRVLEHAPADIHRGELERLLRATVTGEYGRVFRFIAPSDRELAMYPYLRYEMFYLMGFLRLLRAGRPHNWDYINPPGISGKIDFVTFKTCTNYRSFLAAIRGSFFYKPLAAAAPDGTMPDYTAADITVHNHYFTSLLAAATKRYRGKTRETFEEAIGIQTDMANITRIFRLRRFYPNRDTDISGCLARQYRVSRTFLDALFASPDDETAYTLLKASRYAKLFSDNTFDTIEGYYFKALYDFNRRRYRSAPDAYTPLAYLFLKEAELRVLIHTIECIRYGITEV